MKLPIIFTKSFLICLTVLLILLQQNPVSAADASSSLLDLPTPSRTIYFLYKKMANQNVNIESVLRNTKVFRDASGDEQSNMLLTQKPALQAEYDTLDPKHQVIVIRSAVSLKASITGNPGIKASFGRPQPANSIYFPYSWGGTDIALIPDKLAPFLDIPMKMNEATLAAGKITNDAATIVIEMLPLSVDKSSPMTLDGVPQWLLMTRIVSVAYYNERMQTIWAWQAADFRRAGSASPLLDLKK